MDKAELGRRIKEARLSKKMTQSDLAGDFITRNMLSLIESGSASPSIKTLEYLAQQLNVPYQQLLPQDEIGLDSSEGTKLKGSYESFNALINGKEYFKAKHYEKTINVLKEYADTPCRIRDEASAIVARSYLMLAKPKSRNDREINYEYAKLAVKYSGVGLYANREVKTEALLLLEGII